MQQVRTYRLFDIDSHLFTFYGTVTECRDMGDGLYAVVLDRTAFFPEGGGQSADVGTLEDIPVIDVKETGGRIEHMIPKPLNVGALVCGRLDPEIRMNRMQNHSGEHILSGIAHRLFGCSNVGFHLTDQFETVDFDKVLTEEQIKELEMKANAVVVSNVPVTAVYPDSETLAGLSYRSKLDLKENVRIVTIEGVDMCACCAPHVKRTGEIGMIKILGTVKNRGGIRLTVVCGTAALREFGLRVDQDAAISRFLSAPADALYEGLQKYAQSQQSLKEEFTELKKAYVSDRIRSFSERTVQDPNENLFVQLPFSDTLALRNLVNGLMPLTGGMVCGIIPQTGGAWVYILGRESGGLKTTVIKLNEALEGRGGGSDSMVQGTFVADPETIKKTIQTFVL